MPVNEDMSLLEGREVEVADEEDEEPGKEGEVESGETPDEEEESEEEPEKLESDEDAELPESPFKRPGIKELKADFPDIFRKYPEMKDVIFREREFTSLFPTVDDAKEAVEDTEAFEIIRDAALTGDPMPVIDSLATTDKAAFRTFAVDFLNSVYKKDPEVYQEAITPHFESLLRQAYKAGDENLRNSVANVAQWLFGDDGEAIAKGSKTISKLGELKKEQETLKAKKDNDFATNFRAAAGEISGSFERSVKSEALKGFDPDKIFSPLVREKLVEEIIRQLNNTLKDSKAHQTVMRARWKKAGQKGFSKEEKSKILSTLLARARPLIPKIREEVRQSALGKSGRSQTRMEPIKRSEKITPGRPPNSSNMRIVEKKDYRKMSDEDIIAM